MISLVDWPNLQACPNELFDKLRNTLVCDSTQEGKKLSWGQGGERHKVATVDGTLFAKAGAITGGTAADMSGRAQRWDDKAYETLKQVPFSSTMPKPDLLYNMIV